MASKKKSSSTKKTTSKAPAPKKVTSSYTTSSGQKVTKYSDGTKTYSGGTSSKSTPAKAPAPQTRDEQIKAALETAKRIQTGIKENASTFTEADREKLGAGLKGAQTQLDKYVAKEPKAVQDRVALAKAQAPGNAALVNPAFAETTIPEMDPSIVNPANAVAVSNGMKSYMDAFQKQLQQQQARNDKMAKENQSLMEKTLGTMKNPEDVYDKAWKDTGMSTKEYFATQEKGITEIESLNNEYAAVQGAMEQQIAQSNDKMASMNFINNQTAQIRRNAEPQLNTLSAKISSKSATLQALQGNFAEARSLVRDAVDAATAGNKFKYDMYTAMYNQNRDNFDRVDKAYSEAFSNAMNVALKDYEMQREEKMQIGELMLKYPSAGIDINGSLDEAFDRAGLVSGSGSKADLTADMKNYEYAKAGGYTGTFAEWLGKNGTDSGKLPKEVFSLGLSGDSEEAQDRYRALEQLGMTSSDIIAIQNELNAGKTLKEIAEESGMPNSLYLELQNNYITKFGE